MIKEIDIFAWEKFADNSGLDSPFFDKQWLLLLSGHYKLPLHILGYYENENLLFSIPFVIKKTVTGKKKLLCLPFTDYLDFKKEFSKELLDQIKKYISNQYVSADIRACILPVSQEFPYIYHHYLKIGQDGYDEIRKNFNENTKRNLRIAERYPMAVNIGVEKEYLRTFFRLNAWTRKKHGLPPQAYSFFKKIKEDIFEKNLGFIANVNMGSNNVASALFMVKGKTIVYKYGASDEKYLYARPNHFLFDYMIKFACSKGYEYFDFGICPAYNEGLRQFKRGWGAGEKYIAYSRISKDGITMYEKKRPGKIIRIFFKLMPVKVNILIGLWLYKLIA